ncbi:zf-HC2 domain-containing protein [Myxococcaceae bacterium GXIMD 01537]
MTCQELDRFLYPYLDGEFQPEERIDVEAHLAGCADCAQRVEEEQQMRQALRRAARHSVQSARAPASLRAGIQAGLHREQRRAQVGVWLRASAAALVVITAGGTWVALQAGERQRFIVDAAKRHAKRLPYEIASVTPEVVEAWFDGKLDHPVSLPRLPNAVVSGARISNVKDRPAAYISYEAAPVEDGAPTRHFGLFVFDDTRRDVRAQALPSVEVNSAEGYNVALWREGEIVYELVSDLDEADIRKMLAQQQAGQDARLASNPPRPVKALPQVAVEPASLEP